MKDFEVVCWPNTVQKFNRIALFLLSLTAHAEIHLSTAESLTQENGLQYCRDLGAGWHLMSIGEIYALPKSTPFDLTYSYWSSNQTTADNTETGTGSQGDGGFTPMLGYSFYPKERNISLSPGWKKIAAACSNEPETKRIRAYHLVAEGTEDPSLHLLWHELDATDKRAKYTYDEAVMMCENLTLYNRSWRLPTTEELYGIVDYTHTRPAVDMKFFGPMIHRYYWSSDLLNEKEAYVVGFKLGSVATAPRKESASARCVSDQ